MANLVKILMLCICLAPLAANAERYYTDSDRPGFWWGKDPAEEKKQEEAPPAPEKPKPEEKKPVPPEKRYEWESRKELKFNDFTPQQLWDMDPKEFDALFDAFKNQSVRTLKEEHVHDVYRMVDHARRKAAGFANVQQLVMSKYPDVSMEHDSSINPPGQEAIRRMRQDEVSRKMAAAPNEYGLVYFYKPNCPYCEAEERVLQTFNASRHMEIKGVDITQHPDMASRFNITITPTLILVQRGNDGYQPISYGVVSLEELDYRVYSTIRLMEGEIAPEQYGVRDYERGGAYDPLAPLNRGKEKGEAR